MSSSISTSDPGVDEIYASLVVVPPGPMRKFMWTFLIGAALVLGSVEAIYRMYPVMRQEVDVTLHKLDSVHDQNFETILFGDSVARTPLWGVKLAEGTYSLAASAAVTPLGYELIARRFFEQGNTARQAIVFVSPNVLRLPVKSSYFDTHFGGVFDRWSEKALVRERLGSDPYGANPAISLRLNAVKNYFDPQFELLEVPRKVMPASIVDQPKHLPTAPKVRQLVESMKGKTPDTIYAMKNESLGNLTAFVTYLRSHKVEVKLVVVPVMTAAADMMMQGPMGNRLRDLAKLDGVSLVNMNDWLTLPPEAFADGVHLDPLWQDQFVNLVQQRVAPIVAPDAFGDVSRYAIGQIWRSDSFYYRSAIPVQRNGTTGLISRRVDVPFSISEAGTYCVRVQVLSESEYTNSLLWQLNLGPQQTWHFNRLSPDWAWYQSQPVRIETGLNILRFAKREDTPLSGVEVIPCKPA